MGGAPEDADDYGALFARRGAAYARAMRAAPRARAGEFEAVVARAALRGGERVGDVPAGGGELRDYLPRDCLWLGHEPCASLSGASGHLGGALLPLPWADGALDVAISVAGLHHVRALQPLFAALHRAVRPGGRCVLADVAEESAVARFLDGYVDAHNSTGHRGHYLGRHSAEALTAAGWQLRSSARVPLHWTFPDRTALGAFCHGLFDLVRGSPADTAAAAEAALGVDPLPGGGVGLRWELMMLVAERADG